VALFVAHEQIFTQNAAAADLAVLQPKMFVCTGNTALCGLLRTACVSLFGIFW
jgi:hypothetical protein